MSTEFANSPTTSKLANGKPTTSDEVGDLNRGRGVPNKSAVAEVLLDQVTAGYLPSTGLRGLGWSYDAWPEWQFYLDVWNMLDHSSVKTPLMISQAPIRFCEHEVKGSGPTVEAFARSQLERFWSQSLRPLMDSYQPFGWGGGEVVYQAPGKYMAFDQIRVASPRDISPLILKGKMVGIRQTHLPEGEKRMWLGADRVPSKGFWHANFPKFGSFYGQSELKSAWRDWKRLTGRNCLEETGDLAADRHLLGYLKIGFPPEGAKNARGEKEPARDVALALAEMMRNSGNIILPTSKYSQNEGGGDKWTAELLNPESNLNEITEREDTLRKRIAESIGVLSEIMEASNTGSGFSGRFFPFATFLQTRQDHAEAITNTFVELVLKPLVFWNFGAKAWVTVSVKNLLETFLKMFAQQAGGGAAGAPTAPGEAAPVGGEPTDPANPTAPPATATTPDGKPIAPEHVLASIVKAQQEARLSGDPHANDREIDILKGMMHGGEGDETQVKTALGDVGLDVAEEDEDTTAVHVALGWTPAQSKSGHPKAIGTGENAGREPLYGEEALRALRGGGAPPVQENPSTPSSGSPQAANPSATAAPPKPKKPRVSQASAFSVLDKLHRNKPITLDDVSAFVKHTKTMSDGELESVHNILVNRLGGTESHDRAVKHLRGLARQVMAQRGETSNSTATQPVEQGRPRPTTPAKLHLDPERPRPTTPAKLHLDPDKQKSLNSNTLPKAGNPQPQAPNQATPSKPSIPANQSQLLKDIQKKASERDMNDGMRELSGVNLKQRAAGLSKDVASKFDAHGTSNLQSLTKLLNGGVDSSREFYTSPLSEALHGQSGHGHGTTVRDNSSFVVLGHPGKTLKEGGIGGVLVDPLHEPMIPQLQQAFPHVKFVGTSQAHQSLAKVSQGAKGISYQTPATPSAAATPKQTNPNQPQGSVPTLREATPQEIAAQKAKQVPTKAQGINPDEVIRQERDDNWQAKIDASRKQAAQVAPSTAPKSPKSELEKTGQEIRDGFAAIGAGVHDAAHEKQWEYAKRIHAGEKAEKVMEGLRPNGATWNAVHEKLKQLQSPQTAPTKQPSTDPFAEYEPTAKKPQAVGDRNSQLMEPKRSAESEVKSTPATKYNLPPIPAGANRHLHFTGSPEQAIGIGAKGLDYSYHGVLENTADMHGDNSAEVDKAIREQSYGPYSRKKFGNHVVVMDIPEREARNHNVHEKASGLVHPSRVAGHIDRETGVFTKNPLYDPSKDISAEQKKAPTPLAQKAKRPSSDAPTEPPAKPNDLRPNDALDAAFNEPTKTPATTPKPVVPVAMRDHEISDKDVETLTKTAQDKNAPAGRLKATPQKVPTAPTIRPNLIVQPKPERRIHPHLAATDAFKTAPRDVQDHLRDIHANNLGRGSKALQTAAHRQDRALEEAREYDPASVGQHQATANLLWEMHGQARRDEQKAKLKPTAPAKTSANPKQGTLAEESKPVVSPQEQRRMERMQTTEAKRIPQNKLRHVVRQIGGIDPESYQKHFGNVKEDLKEGGLQSLIRHKKERVAGNQITGDTGGKPLDEIADELQASGHIRPPEHMHATDYLIQKLLNDDDHELGVSDEHAHEHAYHQHMMEEYAKHKAAFAAEMEAARNGDSHESEIAQVVRSSKADGKDEAHSSLPPDAKEGPGPEDDWEPGHEDGLGDDGEPRGDHPGGSGGHGAGVDDFPFGANVPEEEQHADEDIDSNPFTPDVPGVRHTEKQSVEPQQQEQQAPAPEATPTPAAQAPQEQPAKQPHEMTAHEALKAGVPYRDWHNSVTDAYRNEVTPEDDPNYHTLAKHTPQMAEDYQRAQKHLGKQVVNKHGEEHTLTDVAPDLSHVELTDANGEKSKHAMQDVSSVEGYVQSGVEKAKDGSLHPASAARIAPYIAKDIVGSNGNLFSKLRELGVSPISIGGKVLRDAVAKELEKAKTDKSAPSPERQNAMEKAKQKEPPTDADREEAMAHGFNQQRNAEALGATSEAKDQKVEESLRKADEASQSPWSRDNNGEWQYQPKTDPNIGELSDEQVKQAAKDAEERRKNNPQPLPPNPMANMTPDEAEALHAEQTKKGQPDANPKQAAPTAPPQAETKASEANAATTSATAEEGTQAEVKSKPKPKAPRKQAVPQTKIETDAAHWQTAANNLREQGFHPSGKKLAEEFKRLQQEHKAKSKPTEAPAVEPHTMRQAAYVPQHKPEGARQTVGEMADAHRQLANGKNRTLSFKALQKAQNDAKEHHKKAVEEALAAGKEVSPEALRDYPQLAKKAEAEKPASSKDEPIDHDRLSFLKSIHEAMHKVPGEGGTLGDLNDKVGSKRLIADVHREWAKDHPGVSLDQFKEALMRQHRQGEGAGLNRADLTLGYKGKDKEGHERLAESQINDPLGEQYGTYHVLHNRELERAIQEAEGTGKK